MMVQAHEDPDPAPLAGTLVVDLSRMLPGAVLDRQLVDLGARVVKVEEPGTGDPMRLSPPFVDGVGAGFVALCRGTESVCLDLRDPGGSLAVQRLAARADVLVESFRPGTMDRWSLGPDDLLAVNRGLVYCSLNSFGRTGAAAGRVGHDLNFLAESGLLAVLPADGVPGIQLADVTSGLLAASSILAALLRRERTGRGAVLDQPLASGPLPFLTWAWADAAVGETGALETLLAGRTPCYRRYRCADGLELAVAAVEPKFWLEFLEMLDLTHLAAAGWDPGCDGAEAAAEVARSLSTRPRQAWVDESARRGLPVTPVNDLDAGRTAAIADSSLAVEEAAGPDDSRLTVPGPWLAAGRSPGRPAPALGEHTEAILRELGITGQ